MTKMKLEIVTVRLSEGTLLQIDALLKGGEIRAAFIRTAIANEIQRRINERGSIPQRRVEHRP